MSKTVEATPVGLRTPEGVARVNAAMEAQKRPGLVGNFVAIR